MKFKSKTYHFNPFQKAWIAALKSGKYRKACGQLSKSGRYCCLGVACEIARITPELQVSVVRERTDDGDFTYDNREQYLPTRITTALKLRGDSGSFKDYIETDSATAHGLTDLNDDARWSHRKIAEYIEANPWNVFTS